MAITNQEQAAQLADLIARISANQGSAKTKSTQEDIETLYTLIAGAAASGGDITLDPQETTYGPSIAFVHTDNGSEVDIITPGITEITRGISQQIFNIAVEGSASSASPTNTEWNSVFTDPTLNGFGDLTNIKERIYNTFTNALNGSVGSNIIGTDLVMHDLITDKYYTFVFSQWTSGAGGGGFAYARQEVEVSDLKKVTFSDNTVQDSAAGEVVSGSGINVVKTIGLDNKVTYTVNSLSAGVSYSAVLFVDPVNGNNATAAAGDFTKPYLTISNALNAANASTPTLTNRALVWIRKGEYVNVNAIIPYNNCDVYCEPGVVFTGSFQCWDTYLGSATNFNWYGYAKWSLNMSTTAFRWQYASTVFFQGDSFVNSGAISIAFNVTVGTSNIVYDFNSIESTQTAGNGYGFSWRNNCNGTVNAKNYIKVNQVSHDIRANHSGNITINCPRNIMTAASVFGGNFKQIVYSSSSQATSKIVINGDLFDEGGYFGGISAMLLIQIGSCEIIHNGNIQCNTVGIWQGSAGRIITNGTITSTQTIGVNNGSGETYCKNGTLSVTGLTSIREFYVSGTARSWFINTPMFMEKVDSVMIQQDSNTSKIFMINVAAEGGGLLGTLVNAAVAGTINQFTNVVSNKANVNVINELAQGFTVDALIQTPKF